MKTLNTIFKLPQLSLAVSLLIIFYIIETFMLVIYYVTEKPLYFLLGYLEKIIKYLIKKI